MEIIEITRGHIKIKVEDKTITIQGEGLLLINGNNISYVVYSNSIKKWDEPFADLKIIENQKDEILNFVINDFKKRGQNIEIE